MMKEFNENGFVGKTIKEIYVDGYHVTIRTADGFILNYDASDGGYSTWEVIENE